MSHVATYVGFVHQAEQTLGDSFRTVADAHVEEADVFHMCHTLAAMNDAHVDAIGPIAERYGEEKVDEPERLHLAGLATGRGGGVGLLRDLQDLYAMASLVQTTWTALEQVAQGRRDDELRAVAESSSADIGRQLRWLNTHLKVAAPQALLIDPLPVAPV
jgi:hypothetical protein